MTARQFKLWHKIFPYIFLFQTDFSFLLINNNCWWNPSGPVEVINFFITIFYEQSYRLERGRDPTWTIVKPNVLLARSLVLNRSETHLFQWSNVGLKCETNFPQIRCDFSWRDKWKWTPFQATGNKSQKFPTCCFVLWKFDGIRCITEVMRVLLLLCRVQFIHFFRERFFFVLVENSGTFFSSHSYLDTNKGEEYANGFKGKPWINLFKVIQ